MTPVRSSLTPGGMGPRLESWDDLPNLPGKMVSDTSFHSVLLSAFKPFASSLFDEMRVTPGRRGSSTRCACFEPARQHVRQARALAVGRVVWHHQ